MFEVEKIISTSQYFEHTKWKGLAKCKLYRYKYSYMVSHDNERVDILSYVFLKGFMFETLAFFS